MIPGDILIKTVTIFSSKYSVNVTELVKLMTVHESIITPGIVVEMNMDDTKNILSNMPILGDERVVIEFAAPGRKDRKLELVVSSVNSGEPSENLRSKSYLIECVSPEVIKDKSIQVCKSYNTNISKIVEDIAKQYLNTKKKVSVEETRGVQKIIIPSMNPYNAINMLRSRSMSTENKSSMYAFFENKDGFHYKTVEKLFTEGSVGDRKFFSDNTSRTDVKKSQFRNIISHEEPDQFNLVNRVSTGGISHEVRKFDIKTLEYKSTVAKFKSDDFKSADGKMKNPDNEEVAEKYGQNAGSNSWVTHDSGDPDTFISDGLGGRKNSGTLYGQGFLNLHVYGDSELTVGQLMEIDIPQNTATTQSPSTHEQNAGKYVIAFLKHIIGPEGNNPRYTCAIEALKGGYHK